MFPTLSHTSHPVMCHNHTVCSPSVVHCQCVHVEVTSEVAPESDVVSGFVLNFFSCQTNRFDTLNFRTTLNVTIGLKLKFTPFIEASGCPCCVTGSVRLVSVSCGSQNVWAVDSRGLVYFRVGTQPLNPSMMLPAWIHIEPPAQVTHASLTHTSARGEPSSVQVTGSPCFCSQ